MVEQMRQYRPIETEHGFLAGRDCIFLDEISFQYRTNTVVLKGEVNGNLVSNPPEDGSRWIPYQLVFSGVLALKMLELDSWDFECASSFDEILDSEWMAALGGKVTTDHKHLLVQTYDDVFELVCSSCEFSYLAA
jgi:hypothetical protein